MMQLQKMVSKTNVIIALVAALFTVIAFASIVKKRDENEPGELGSVASDNENMFPYETKNFKQSEFDCRDGTKVPEKYYGNLGLLMHNLQIVRDEIGLPIIVNSGYRSPAYNASLPNAAPNSTHMRALAADIRIVGMTPKQVYNKILALINAGRIKEGGLGLYAGFVHYDVRGYKARW